MKCLTAVVLLLACTAIGCEGDFHIAYPKVGDCYMGDYTEDLFKVVEVGKYSLKVIRQDGTRLVTPTIKPHHIVDCFDAFDNIKEK